MDNLNHKKGNQLTEAEILRKIDRSSVNSAEQYELIITNLQQQNQKLFKDRQQLSSKVAVLKEKQIQMIKQEKSKGKVDPTKHYNRLRRELEASYKEFEGYQKKFYNSMNKNAINIQLRELVNKFFVVEQQTKQVRAQLIDEKKTFKQLQKSIKSQLKQINRNLPQYEKLQDSNKELKKKIWEMKIIEDLTEHIEIRVQDNIIGLKQKGTFFQKLNTLTVQEVKRQEMQSKLEIVSKDQSRLQTNNSKRIKTEIMGGSRNKRYRTESHDKRSMKEELKDMIHIKQEKVIEKKEAKSALEFQLNNIQIQFNQLQQIMSDLKMELMKQEQKRQHKDQEMLAKLEIEVCDVSVQVDTEYEDPNPLRIDEIGNMQGQSYQINDRILLKRQKQTLINGLMCYQNRLGIASIRASYSIGKITPVYSNIPDKYLKENCKMKKVVLSDPKDHLKWFKVYFCHEQKRILRLEVFSHNKIKFEVGKPKEDLFGDPNVLAYKMDLTTTEIPVCLRTSYKAVKGKDWVLSSFGLQINQNQ